MTPTQAFVLPTVSLSNNTGIDLFAEPYLDNYDEVRGRSLSTNKCTSKDSSMFSMKSSVVYHDRMECNNTMVVNEEIVDVSSALSNKTGQIKALHVSKATEQQDNTRSKCNNLKASNSNPQCVLNKEQHSIPTCGPTTQFEDDNVINIQLPYDPQAPTELELWSGNFHPISLHNSIEHIALNTKNIKNSLNFMARYITNKLVDSSKLNDLEDFNGIGEAIWNFISSVFQSNWDFLYADKQSNSFRRKIVTKFTPRVNLSPGKNNKETNKHVPANINRIPLPVLAKSQKEVNAISKYFKSNKPATDPKKSAMLYAQASKQNTSTSEVIKIKEAFPSIGAKKINQINNIVNGILKLKPHIKMTMKGPSRKHVIIPMSNDNNAKFMRDSSTHVANINRALKNAKLEVLVDFICSDPLGITVVTNKVSLQLDLLIIKHYIKNSKDINALQVDVPCIHPPIKILSQNYRYPILSTW